MPQTVLALVHDLFFYSKIRQAVVELGMKLAAAEPDNLQERALDKKPTLILVELGPSLEKTLEAVRLLKANPTLAHTRVMAFGSHVQTDFLKQAKEAGCDGVVSKGELTARLPQILAQA